MISLVVLAFVACTSDDKSVVAFKSVCKDDEASCFERECSKNNAYSCLRLSELAYWGQGGVQKDEKKAKALLEKGCELDYGFACEKLGDLYRFADTNIKADEKTAKSYYDKSTKPARQTMVRRVTGWDTCICMEALITLAMRALKRI